MNKLVEMAVALTVMEVENTLHSKVDGRRNWVIRVETWTTTDGERKRVITYRGGYGFACDHGFMGCFVREIGERNIRWYTFTYKKDYQAAVNALKIAKAHDFWGDLQGLN